MKKKTRDRNMPVGKLKRVADFLPPPHELAMPEETVKVTLALDRASVEFFKRAAQKHRKKYQRMIREVLDLYVSRFKAA